MFKITCMKCGKETEINKDTHVGSDKNDVVIYAGREGEIFIDCDCGNEVES